MWEDLSSRKYWFNTQRWRVKFGVRGGDLRFQLVGMSSPSSARRFRSGLPIGDTVEVSCAEERAESHKITQDFSFTGKASKDPFSISMKHSDGGQLSEKANLAHKYQIAMVKI
jgi:hypothetical protein